MNITHNQQGQIVLSSMLRSAVYLTAVIDLVIGLLFLFGPELGITLWPSQVSAVLMRFIGAIVVGNGIGAGLAASQGTWEGARVLFTVALVYGVVVFFGLLYQLLVGNADSVFWAYIVVDAIFLLPILYIYVIHERAYRTM